MSIKNHVKKRGFVVHTFRMKNHAFEFSRRAFSGRLIDEWPFDDRLREFGAERHGSHVVLVESDLNWLWLVDLLVAQHDELRSRVGFAVRVLGHALVDATVGRHRLNDEQRVYVVLGELLDARVHLQRFVVLVPAYYRARVAHCLSLKFNWIAAVYREVLEVHENSRRQVSPFGFKFTTTTT